MNVTEKTLFGTNDTHDVNRTSYGPMSTSRRELGLEYYVLSDETVKMIKIVCYIGVCPGLLIAGLVMNSMCVVLFWKTKVKSSMNVLLFALSVTDVVYCIAAALNTLFSATEFFKLPFTNTQRLQAVPIFYSCIRLIPGRYGALLTMAISTERMLSVVYPIKIRQISKRRNAIIIVVVALLTTVGFHIPMGLFNTTKLVYIPVTKSYIRIITPTDLGKRTDLVALVYSMNEVLFNFSPVLGVMISCGITAFVVHKTAKLRSKMTTQTSKSGLEMQVTKTLLVLVFVFIVCKAPATLLSLVIFINMKPYRYSSNVYEVAMAIAYIPLVINSVVNLLIYYKTSTLYRREIQMMFNQYRRNEKLQTKDKRPVEKVCRRDELTVSTIGITSSAEKESSRNESAKEDTKTF